jgi:DNA repair exonuclease SbcCD ATPase subunit
MIEVKYEYLFNELNEIVPFTNAIKGDKYRLYPNAPLDYIFRQGEVNTPHFSLKSNNPFAGVNNNSSGSGGESIEHHNAKMKIAYELKYYDTIFEQWIEFDKVIPEFSHENKKRPDLSCYQNGKLAACIEIFKTSKKSEQDIEILKKLDCLIIEIDINNENRCEHIALPKVLESNREKYKELSEQYKRAKREEQSDLSERVQFAVRIETQFDYDPSEKLRELEREYKETAEKCQSGLSKIIEEVKIFESEVERKTTTRTERINIWLQKRLSKVKGRIDTIKAAKSEFDSVESELQRTKNEINRIENASQKTDYGIGKLESEIQELENNIRQRKHSFNEIAKQSKIEWFRNSWIKSEPQNIIQEIKYWLQ